MVAKCWTHPDWLRLLQALGPGDLLQENIPLKIARGHHFKDGYFKNVLETETANGGKN